MDYKFKSNIYTNILKKFDVNLAKLQISNEQIGSIEIRLDRIS